MKYVFIINGKAKKEFKQQLDKKIRHLYDGRDYVIEYTAYPCHATKIARHYTTTCKDLRIYACGGDGTLHEVANGIYPYTHVQLAIIPIGTGNDFVRSFGYDRSDFRHLENYEHPTFLWSDLTKVYDKNHTEISINTVSLGFDVTIAQNMPRFRNIANATNAYYLAMLCSLTKKINTLFQLEVDGVRLKDRKYMFVVMANGNYYGGGYKPCPQASISDGYLDFCVIHDIPVYRIFDLSLEYKKGTHLRYKQYASNQKAKKVAVLNPGPIQINLDGEVRTMVQPVIEIIPHQIQICIPKKTIQ